MPLLALGESGVGKDDVARRYHEASGRPGRLVELNAASIPRDLVEAELFGTRRGAYSGTVDRDGAFARADRGTLLLDEIGAGEIEAKPARAATLREEDRAGKKRAFRAALKRHGGDVGKAAAEVGVSRATAFRWMAGG